jgi:hypothetical protein
MKCKRSGKEFYIGAVESDLRRQLGIESIPKWSPLERIRLLGAFWQHRGLYTT